MRDFRKFWPEKNDAATTFQARVDEPISKETISAPETAYRSFDPFRPEVFEYRGCSESREPEDAATRG